MVEAEMTEQEQRELDLTVAEIFANNPTVTIAKVAQQLGRPRKQVS